MKLGTFLMLPYLPTRRCLLLNGTKHTLSATGYYQLINKWSTDTTNSDLNVIHGDHVITSYIYVHVYVYALK